VVLIDEAWQQAAHDPLVARCGSAEFIVRNEGGRRDTLGSILPHAVSEYANQDLAWLLHRQIYLSGIDVVQLEYTRSANTPPPSAASPSSCSSTTSTSSPSPAGFAQARGLAAKLSSRFEYLRALRWELNMLPRVDRIQVCSPQKQRLLVSFLPR
jgi:hypothetical protein